MESGGGVGSDTNRGRPTDLALVASATTVAVVACLLPAGVAADRYSQKYLMLLVHATQGLVLGTLAVLALAERTQLWHILIAGVVAGAATAFAFPAYSSWLPALVQPEDLLAVNGVEGMLRPAIMLALGPAIAGVLISASSPGLAIAVAAASSVAALLATSPVPLTPPRGGETADAGVAGAVRDVREGAVYLIRTRWLFASLIMASLMVMIVMGPIEVVLPFLLRDELFVGAGSHSIALAAFGIGGAVASFAISSRPFPRRYLTVTTAMWASASVPILVIGVAEHLIVIVAACAVLGACFSAPNVLWGTLLQRRIPRRLLGRVSSLDSSSPTHSTRHRWHWPAHLPRRSAPGTPSWPSVRCRSWRSS